VESLFADVGVYNLSRDWRKPKKICGGVTSFQFGNRNWVSQNTNKKYNEVYIFKTFYIMKSLSEMMMMMMMAVIVIIIINCPILYFMRFLLFIRTSANLVIGLWALKFAFNKQVLKWIIIIIIVFAIFQKSLLPNRYRDPFPQNLCDQKMKLTTYLSQMPRLRMLWVTPSLFHMHSWHATEIQSILCPNTIIL
jgi:hypothetical protein